MKKIFKELLEYTHHYNNAIIHVLISNEDKVSEKMLQLMSHIINAHQIWNTRFKTKKQMLPAPWSNHAIANLANMENENFNQSLYALDTNDLNALIEWQSLTGSNFKSSMQDILFQIVNHSNYHRAQIATEFRLNGLDPILTDFIYYKMSGIVID